MITGIREKTIVKENRKVELSSTDLPIGIEVEVIVLVEEEQDATEYLLSTEANRQNLEEALEELKHPEKFIQINLEDYESDKINS